jgi:hypothetical protein
VNVRVHKRCVSRAWIPIKLPRSAAAHLFTALHVEVNVPQGQGCTREVAQ